LINNYFSQQVTYEQGKALADETVKGLSKDFGEKFALVC
jgi:hypothetical protein